MSGRYLQRTTTFRGTEKQARKALAVFVARVASGSERGSDTTVGELMDAWLELATDNVSLNTLQGYRSKARHRIVPELGAIPLRKLSGPDLERWYRRLLHDAGLAPSHVRQIHAIVHNALAHAVRWGWLSVNPADAARPPSVPKREIRPPEVGHVLAAVEAAAPEFGVFVRLLFSPEPDGSRPWDPYHWTTAWRRLRESSICLRQPVCTTCATSQPLIFSLTALTSRPLPGALVMRTRQPH